MELRQNSKYALAVPTSMGIRLTPAQGKSVHCADCFSVSATSAETNVATVMSSLGEKTVALTKFVANSPIAALIKRDLSARHIEYTGKEIEQGDPWGYRHQFNVADSGFGLKAPRVFNDRAGEVGRTIRADEFDLDKLFCEDGVKILHMSGLIAALSDETRELCVTLAEKAKKCGTKVSFDLNYRESFWKDRKDSLSEAFSKIARLADILIGNEEDYQYCLGISGPETGGAGLNDKITAFENMIKLASARYPDVCVFATTLRQVETAERHFWGSILYTEGAFDVIEPRPISVRDRIGGGDAYVGGMLYGIVKGYAAEKCNRLGWASGALAAASDTDYAVPADEKQLLDIYAGNARVQR